MLRDRSPDSFSLFDSFKPTTGRKISRNQIEPKFKVEELASLLVIDSMSQKTRPLSIVSYQNLPPDLPSPVHVGARSVFDDIMLHSRESLRRGYPVSPMKSPGRRRGPDDAVGRFHMAHLSDTHALSDSRRRFAVVMSTTAARPPSRNYPSRNYTPIFDLPSSLDEVGWIPARPRVAIAARPVASESQRLIASQPPSVVLWPPDDGPGRAGHAAPLSPSFILYSTTRIEPAAPVGPASANDWATEPGPSHPYPTPPPAAPELSPEPARRISSEPARRTPVAVGQSRRRGFNLETVEEEGAWL
jgi:hypothetical protein